jgi:heat shock protein HslJ
LMLPMVLGMMISCSEAKTDAKKLEGKWNVVEVKGEKILKEGLPYMEFDMAQNKLHGNAGCNMFNTTITLDANDVSSITIAPGAATMMACPDMATEDAIMKAMGDVKAVKAGNSESEMTLVDQDGNVLLVLSKN